MSGKYDDIINMPASCVHAAQADEPRRPRCTVFAVFCADGI